MLKTDEVKIKVQEIVQHDPLFAVLRDTPLEEVLYTDTYLLDIIEKKYYSTPEVAGWFDITDAQLRYYIKPFEYYIFDDMTENPTTATVIRLNLPAILKLRMILLLKDEYRVKGLKRLLGIDENGHLVKQQPAASTALGPTDEIANKMDVLSNVLQQMMQTGLFHMQQDEESGATQITINQDFLAQNIQLLSSESTQQLSEIQNRTEKLTEENESLQKQMNEMKDNYVKDVAIQIRERHIEHEVMLALRNEAIEAFATQKKSRLFAKVFRSSQIELQKEQFVAAYITEHLADRLEIQLGKYYGK